MRKAVSVPRWILLVFLVGCGSAQSTEPVRESAVDSALAILPASMPTSMPTDGAVEHAEHPPADADGGGHHHGFEDPEQWAERWNSPERDEWQQPARVMELMEISPGMVVAEIGAGTGYFLTHLANAAGADGRVYCLDVEPAMVAYLNQRIADEGIATATAIVVPPDDPGLEPHGLDRVLFVNTWHHIEGRPAYAAHVRAGLALGGTVTIVEYDMVAEPGPPLEMRLLPEEVIADFEAAGFEAEVVGTLPRQYVVRAVLRDE